MPKTTKSKTVGAIGSDVRTLTDAQLIAYADQLTGELESADAEARAAKEAVEMAETALRDLRHDWNEATSAVGRIRGRIDTIAGEQLRRAVGFDVGDVVEDDQGVRYRVHRIYFSESTEYRSRKGERVPAGSVYGIRLTSSGAEAYAKPRQIVSSAPLRKVDVE